jgi:hypothetical protein
LQLNKEEKMKSQTIALALISVAAVLAFGYSAHAQDNYQLSVQRTQGDMTCVIDTSAGGSANCTTNVVEQAQLPITMVALTPGQYGAPADGGYGGADKISGPNGDFVLAILADTAKNVKDIALIQGQSTNQSFDGSISAFAATSASAININPLHLTQVDANTVNMQLSFVSYEPATGAHALTSKQALTNALLAKVQPALLSIRK